MLFLFFFFLAFLMKHLVFETIHLLLNKEISFAPSFFVNRFDRLYISLKHIEKRKIIQLHLSEINKDEHIKIILQSCLSAFHFYWENR